jgi:hypothetical protein
MLDDLLAVSGDIGALSRRKAVVTPVGDWGVVVVVVVALGGRRIVVVIGKGVLVVGGVPWIVSMLPRLLNAALSSLAPWGRLVFVLRLVSLLGRVLGSEGLLGLVLGLVSPLGQNNSVSRPVRLVRGSAAGAAAWSWARRGAR